MDKKQFTFSTIVIILVYLTINGCSKTFDFIAREVIEYKIDGIENFEGFIAQRTLVTPKDMHIISKVMFKKPHFYSTEIVSPEEYAGYRTMFTGDSVTVYWPWEKKAHRVIGLKPMTPEQRSQIVDVVNSEISTNYSFEMKGSSKIANRDSVVFSVIPTPENPLKNKGQVLLDKEWSLPLEIRINDPKGFLMYLYSYRTVLFNRQKVTASFRMEFPEATKVHTWDLSQQPLSLKVASERVDFSILQPSTLPAGFTLLGIHISDSAPPLIMSLFSHDQARITLIQQVRDQESSQKPVPLYLPVITKRGLARYYPLAGLKFLSWDTKNNHFTLVANLPLITLMDMIDSFPE
ncbi:hypothetical protein ACFL27_22380 [candidate division CSSED10-310 bacterium]|uniref:Uncharacterized protein n=1 Tax=candidate division CSSED10-310 bacterium TaxID=2855610 RepID=A0ABV6Z3D0_UNCC1